MEIVTGIMETTFFVAIAYTAGYFSGRLPHAAMDCIKAYHGKKGTGMYEAVLLLSLSLMAALCSIAYMADKSIRQSPTLIFFWFMGFVQPVFYLIAELLERGSRKSNKK